nr:hypothetical protein GCM10020092_060400 [Actinoplanes digitatis]
MIILRGRRCHSRSWRASAGAWLRGSSPSASGCRRTAELAEALSVDRNTVLAAYRRLRDDGVLEFRRGRGARVASSVTEPSPVTEAATTLVAVARRHGLGRQDLIRLIERLT